MRKFLCMLFALGIILSLSLLAFASAFSEESPPSTEFISAGECTPLASTEINEMRIAVTSDSLPQTEYISEEDVVCLSETVVISESFSTPYASLRLEFAGARYGITNIGDEDVVVGENEGATLNIQTLVWAPENYTIRVGFWNISTGVGYYHALTGGDISQTLYYPNLEAGTYRVYVKNMGSTALTTGYMRYTIS